MTVEEAIEDLKSYAENSWGILNETFKMAINALEEIQQYRAIGTVSEFRELKEKATAKHKCPNCNELLSDEYRFCPTCRRKVDWSEGKE
jgi:hypothetical protein